MRGEKSAGGIPGIPGGVKPPSFRMETKRIPMFVCLLHGSSRGNKWFPHTPAVITSTQQAETAEHSATLRAQCVSWTSV